MRQFDCPQCSAPVPFETPAGVFAVCPNCRSMVVRKDIGLEAIGTMAELPPDHSPLQIGTRGEFKGRHFRLLGRLRVRWDGGTWEEWYADFGANRHGWVAETQGFFMISEALEMSVEKAHSLSALRPGHETEIAGKTYQVSDIKKAFAVAGEGELPFVAKPGASWTGMDLTGEGRAFAGVEWHRGGGMPSLFTGLSALPDEIRWENLKPVPGWNGEPVPVEKNLTQAVNCPNCGGVVELRKAGLSATLACGHCGVLIDVDQPRAVVGQKVLSAVASGDPPLPLGRRGVLRGTEWEVLGCLWRKDPYVCWKEILLYNPWKGYAWLTESAGHWNFVTRVPDVPAQGRGGLHLDGVTYQSYGNENTEVVRVVGEFYWRVRVGEKALVRDFISPPYILSSEQYPDLQEVTWSAGEYIKADEVAKAFKVTLFQGGGVYLNQPNPWAKKRGEYLKLGLLGLGAAILIQMASSALFAKKQVLDERITVQQPGVESAPAVSPTFELRGSRRAVVTLEASDGASLAALNAGLVSESTGATVPVPIDSGGTAESISNLPAVAPGKYHLALNPLPSGTLPTAPVRVAVEQGGLFTSNFVLVLLALGFLPVWGIFRHQQFESERWAGS